MNEPDNAQSSRASATASARSASAARPRPPRRGRGSCRGSSAFVLLLTTTAFGFRAYSVGTMPGQGGGPVGDAGSSEKKAERPATASTDVGVGRDGGGPPVEGVRHPAEPRAGQPQGGRAARLDQPRPRWRASRSRPATCSPVIENIDYLADFDQARAGWRAARAAAHRGRADHARGDQAGRGRPRRDAPERRRSRSSTWNATGG